MGPTSHRAGQQRRQHRHRLELARPPLRWTWSLDDDGDSVLRFAASRYHHGLYFGYMILSNPNALAYTVNLWIDFDGDLFADVPEVFTLLATGGGPRHRSIRRQNPLTDELLIGFEQQLFQDFALAVNATYREDDNIIELIKPGFTPPTSYRRRWSTPGSMASAAPVTMAPSPSSIRSRLRPRAGSDQSSASDPGVQGRRGHRPAPPDQQLAGAGVLGLAGGHRHGGHRFEASKGWSYDFDDPNKLINADGPLTQDREWQLEMMGSYMAPLGFIFSGYWEFMTGLPLYRTVTVPLRPGPGSCLRRSQGRASPRGPVAPRPARREGFQSRRPPLGAGAHR